MSTINPSTDLVFVPLKAKWTVKLPDSTTKEFPGGYKGRLAAMEFIAEFNTTAAASA